MPCCLPDLATLTLQMWPCWTFMCDLFHSVMCAADEVIHAAAHMHLCPLIAQYYGSWMCSILLTAHSCSEVGLFPPPVCSQAAAMNTALEDSLSLSLLGLGLC